MYRVGIALTILCLCILPAHAQDDASGFKADQFRKATEEATITQVIDPQTVIAQNGTVYRLAGIDLPGLYDANLPPWIADARKALEDAVKGKVVKIYVSKNADLRMNRLDQILAHLVVKTDNSWVQGYLLENGYARAFPTDTSPELAGEMYQAEQKAMLADKGLWTIPENRPRAADNANDLIGRSGIITGKLISASQAQSMLYLNFGTDWKQDATIGVSSRLRQGLAKQGIDPKAWAGKTVMVRGFVEPYYGPFINLTTPAQLTLIEADQAAARPKPQGQQDIPGGLNFYKVTPDKPEAPEAEAEAEAEPEPEAIKDQDHKEAKPAHAPQS
jgi:micrococcal nuclease